MSGNYYIAGVLAAIGAVLLVLAMAWVGTGPSPDMKMKWDDYEPLTSNVEGVGGSLEVVDVGGVPYIHAKELGDGYIIYEGSKKTVRVEKAIMDLVLMDGQSNAAYHRADPELAVTPEPGTAYYFGYPSLMPSSVDADFGGARILDMNDNGAPQVGDKGPSFAKTYHDATGKKVLWVSLGIPGLTISKWTPGTGSAWEQNVRMMEALHAKLEATPEIETGDCFMLWAQGETDYSLNTGYDHYLRTFDSIKAAMPEAFDVDIQKWYLISGRDKCVGWVNEAYQELAEANDVEVAVGQWLPDSFDIGNGLMSTDDVHYSQQGDNAIGAAVARYIARGQGASLGSAPSYLMENRIPCDLGEALTLPDTVSSYDIDGGCRAVPCTWESTPDTSSYGISFVAGEAEDIVPMLQNIPAPQSRIMTGYIGWVGNIEYIKNGASTCSVMNHRSQLGNLTIPSSVDGVTVTEVERLAFHHVPYTDLVIPDTVTTLESFSIYYLPCLETVYCGDGLDDVQSDSMTIHFYKNGSEIPSSTWSSTPSVLEGYWTWNGTKANHVYYRGDSP